MEWRYLFHLLLGNYKKDWEVFSQAILECSNCVGTTSQNGFRRALLKQLHQSNQATMSHCHIYCLPKKDLVKVPSWGHSGPHSDAQVGEWSKVFVCLGRKSLFCLPYVKWTYQVSEKCVWGFDEMNTGILNACKFTNAYFAALSLCAIVMTFNMSCSFLNHISSVIKLSICIALDKRGHNIWRV